MGRLARFIHFYTDEDDGADVGPTNIVSGNPPLSLVNAIAKKIKKLTQIGKCTVSGTDITCNNGVLKYDAEFGFYTEGTPEEIKVSASGADDQTATASNLFAVGSIADEQDIISGTITRRCEAVVSDGTTPSGRYIGTVGEGNIIVQTKETGYSGAIASFATDKAEPLSGLVAEINPVQDLHGYANPWPAGGGVNKLDPSKLTVYAQGTYGLTVSIVEDGFRVAGTIASDVVPGTKEWRVVATNQPELDLSVLHVKGFFPNATSGHNYSIRPDPSTNTLVISITDVAVGDVIDVTCKSVVYEGSTAPTAWSPYANICPISGWTGVEGQRTGFNVWDETFSAEGKYISSSGAEVTHSAWNISSYIPVKPDTEYYFKNVAQSATSACLAWYDASKTFISATNIESSGFAKTSPSNAAFLRTTVAVSNIGAVSINYPSTDHDYELYTGEAISVSWQDEAGTVYKGTVDPVTGVLIATHKMVTLVGANTEAWGNTYSTAYGAFSITLSDANINGIPSQQLLSNQFVGHEARGAMQSWSVGKLLTYNQVADNKYVFFTTDITDKTQWLAWLANNPTQLLYPLAEPQTYQLTPQEVDTLVGQNNVWVDTGNVTAYVPDFTTEKVTGQSLSTTEGTNTVFVTSNVDPVELEVEYRTP